MAAFTSEWVAAFVSESVAAFTSEWVAAFTSEWWPPSRRNGWPDSLGIPKFLGQIVSITGIPAHLALGMPGASPEDGPP